MAASTVNTGPVNAESFTLPRTNMSAAPIRIAASAPVRRPRAIAHAIAGAATQATAIVAVPARSASEPTAKRVSSRHPTGMPRSHRSSGQPGARPRRYAYAVNTVQPTITANTGRAAHGWAYRWMLRTTSSPAYPSAANRYTASARQSAAFGVPATALMTGGGSAVRPRYPALVCC